MSWSVSYSSTRKFKDAASLLGRARPRFGRSASRAWTATFRPHERNLADEPIHEIELWDLVTAFGRVSCAIDRRLSPQISSTMRRRSTSTWAVSESGSSPRVGLPFGDVFERDMHKSTPGRHLSGEFSSWSDTTSCTPNRAQNFGEIWIVAGCSHRRCVRSFGGRLVRTPVRGRSVRSLRRKAEVEGLLGSPHEANHPNTFRHCESPPSAEANICRSSDGCRARRLI